MGFTPLVNLESMTTKPTAGRGSMESWEEHVLLFDIPISYPGLFYGLFIKVVLYCFTWKDPSRPWAPVFPPPLYKSGHILNMQFKQPIPSYPAKQRHWKRCRRLLWSSWKNVDIFCMKPPLNSVIYSPHTRGDLIAMFKIIHGLLEFPMTSTFAHPTRKGLRGHAYKFHQ